MYKLPANFPVEDWDNLPARTQLARIQRTDLTREEQWTLLNKDGIVSTLGKIQNLQLHQPEYGLSTMALNRASKSLMNIAVARWEAKSADSPFEDPKQRNRFLRMLDERENAVLENARGGGQAPLTGAQFMGYDRQETRVKEAHTEEPPPVRVSEPFAFPDAEEGQVAYIFYTDNDTGHFKEQAEYQAEQLREKGYEPKLICTNDVGDFSGAWEEMDSNTGAAVIISHCNGMSLIFGEPNDTNAMSATGKNKANKAIPAISDLTGPEIETLLLLCCNAGHTDLYEQGEARTNVADAFRDLENVDNVYAYDGSVGFGLPVIGDELYPRLAFDQSGYFDVYRDFDVPYQLGLPSGLYKYEDD